jgi:UDP-N-acetylmuramoylalanine--D-glutamate ligase
VTRALVHGLAITGVATARALLARGVEVVATDDRIDADTRAAADALGLGLDPLPGDLDRFVRTFDVVSPAPGVPETHPLVTAALAAGVELVSEIELAYRWEQDRPGGPRPILAVTGTDGKTTTTEMAVAMLRAAGHLTAAVGNTDVPFVDVLDGDLDVFVVECTSFRLAWTQRFRADAAVWLNLAPDHLNWHASMDTYAAAKERIFALQRTDDVAIGFVDDPTVMAALDRAPGRHRTFGLHGSDYHLDGATLAGPSGPIVPTASMKRRLPHDITNALAASALVLETGLADAAAIEAALAAFDAPPHRLQPVGSAVGVDWYDDSKATTPHAASTAIRAFDSLVLIAGGSRKGVDLAPMAAEAHRVRAVVAIGEAAPDVHAAFDATTRVADAGSMADAVAIAAELARPGDAVVLSPGCASFDWYSGYPARGDDFARLVRAHLDQIDTQQNHTQHHTEVTS